MIYAANFKTNHTRESTKKYIETLNEKLYSKKLEDEVYIFPPSTALDSYKGDFTLGVQNAYPATSGAYTGEIGLEQLNEFDIQTILIGHSERRELLEESQEKVVQKFAFFKEQGFKIIYCISLIRMIFYYLIISFLSYFIYNISQRFKNRGFRG